MRRNAKYRYAYMGGTYSVRELARLTGVKESTIRARLLRSSDMDNVLNLCRNQYKARGNTNVMPDDVDRLSGDTDEHVAHLKSIQDKYRNGIPEGELNKLAGRLVDIFI